MLKVVGNIVSKELKDGLRDKRAMLTLFLMPVFFLGIMYAAIFFILSLQGKSESFELPVQGVSYAEPLIGWFQEAGIDVVEFSGDPVEGVASLENDFVLVIGQDFPDKFKSFKDASIELVYDRSRSNIQGKVNQIKILVQQWSGQIGSLRLVARGVSPRVANPVILEDVNIANDQKLASKLFGMIPVMLILTIFTASIGLSVDMMAGEREKNSLESLLLNPVSREQILAGKWLAAILCTVVVLVMTSVAIYFIVPTLPLEKMGLQYQLTIVDLLWASLAALPLILFATVIQLLVSIFAKSFKEAQSYISLLVTIPMFLAYYVLFTDVNQAWQGWAPVLGSLILMEKIFMGESASVQQWLSATGVLVVLALAIAVVLVKQLKREKIIYG